MKRQAKKQVKSKGALLFKLWRLEHNVSHGKLAKELKISAAAISQWESSTTIPDSQHMLFLMKRANIPFQCWFE